MAETPHEIQQQLRDVAELNVRQAPDAQASTATVQGDCSATNGRSWQRDSFLRKITLPSAAAP